MVAPTKNGRLRLRNIPVDRGYYQDVGNKEILGNRRAIGGKGEDGKSYSFYPKKIKSKSSLQPQQ